MRASITLFAGQVDNEPPVIVAACDYCLTMIETPDVAIGLEWIIEAADRHMDTCERKP